MQQIIHRIPFLVELFFNGSFILLYSLKNTGKIPAAWSMEHVDMALELGTWFIPVVIFFSLIVNYLNSIDFEEFLRKYVFSLVVFIPLVITWGDVEFAFWLTSAHLLSSVLSLYDIDPRRKKQQQFKLPRLGGGLRPAQLVLFSFMGAILLGTFFLMLPFLSSKGSSVGLIDALFIATSATCVTGLSTISISDSFSIWGQLVVLALIQVGGLGIMTLTTIMAILLGRSMRMRERVVMQELLDISSAEGMFALVVDIVKYTFVIELWGAIVLTIGFTMEGYDFLTAIWFGFFHSISAFCNAGFSLFNTSLESFATTPLIHGTIAILVILGGLGFIVLREMKGVIIKRKSLARISLHSKTVLLVSLILILGGAAFIFFGEFLHSLDNYSLWEKAQIAFFQSVTLRTSGFNTIPLGNLHSYTLYVMCLLMFVGASPGSTGGGIKTSTLAILVQSIISTLRGRKRVSLFGRTIEGPIIVRVTALTFISLVLTSFFIFVLMKLEPEQSFLPLFFEVVSAFGTVGLSLGVTSFLSVGGKLAISLLMLIGRIGPLTLMLAIGERSEQESLEYPNGHIMIG